MRVFLRIEHLRWSSSTSTPRFLTLVASQSKINRGPITGLISKRQNLASGRFLVYCQLPNLAASHSRIYDAKMHHNMFNGENEEGVL
ncbi:hypothetical protein NDU88_006476 [Pleurodeles waltl]|uniref:Uncharacterized protein n=1 Tax=Pleurodeles waltl TaxID=8319 RepID=A0AAV7U095_PLEWA|nr:hypothetical protein NDU88_006476 [Pleurodeles waltl]